MNNSGYSYLALGDSYTIGESVSIFESFPYQTVQLLRNEGYDFQPAEIVAKTGWTTDELSDGIYNTTLRSSYDFVSLLIGVNNQYRGRLLDNYRSEFEELLKGAIGFAGGRNDRVAVISIPDWGVTPFAKERDQQQIAKEIDMYNAACEEISSSYRVYFINITPGTREAAGDETLLAGDQLHPSGKEYARWAKKFSEFIIRQLNK